MNLVSIPPIVMATLMSYLGFYHFLIYFKQKNNFENLTFALSCFSMGLYAVCCAGVYSSFSPEVGVQWQRFQVVTLALVGISLIWFITDYTGHGNKKIVQVFTIYYVFAALAGLFVRGELTWTNIASIKEISLPFGYHIIYNEMAPGALTNLQGIVGIFYFMYILMVSLKFYRDGNKEKGLPLLVAMTILFAGLLNDTFVSSGFYNFIYVLEYSYLGIILVFTFFLTNTVIKTSEIKEALEDSEALYRLITENAADVIWTTDMDLNFTYLSPSTRQMRGYSVEESMAQSLDEMILSGSLEKVLNLFAEKLALIESGDSKGWKPAVFETEQYCKDGSIIWTSHNARILPGPDKKPITIVGVTRDVTDRVMAELALKESERKYRRIYDNILDVYYETAFDGTILEISPSIEKFSQYKQEDLIGRSVAELYTNPKDRDKFIEQILKKGSVRDYEIEFTDKDGTKRTSSTNIELIYDSNGNPEKFIGIFRDISERKQAEAEKIRSQKIASEHEKLALVGQIAGKMAHDFNNVLGIIMGNTELSLLECEEPETRETLELILEQTVRGKNLTKNLVAFANDQEPKQEFFSINEKINLVINLLKKDLKGIEVIKEEKSGMPELLADPGMIEHGLINLIQNSVHALSMNEHPKIKIRTYNLDNNIFLEIEDNGCGIPKEYLYKIFEPSFTLKGNKDLRGLYEKGIKGTGYGMANVKKYIEQHKGSISVDSELGSGTKFTIKIPVIEKELTHKEKIGIQEKLSCFGKYILLVEDEQAISDVQYRILTQEPCNHRVDVANNGQIAMDLFLRNKYDCISLDYVLPGDLNGMDVYNNIRETNKTVPILFISGNIQFLESIEELRKKDVNIDHLSKPCQNKDYVDSINKLMERALSVNR